MRTTKLKSILITVAICQFQCERGIGWAQKNYHTALPKRHENALLCMKFVQIVFQTLPPQKNVLANLSLNFHWKVVCPCPGSMEHDSKTCSLACGWAYGCTMLLVAAIIMVKAKHHWNPFVPDTAETTPTATSFCAISIQAFLPRLCPRRSGIWSHLHLITIFCLRSVSARANTAAGGSLAPRFLDHLHLAGSNGLTYGGWGGGGWIVVCGLLALGFMLLLWSLWLLLLLSVLLLVVVAVAAVAAAAAFRGASGNGVSASSPSAAAFGGASDRAAGNGVSASGAWAIKWCCCWWCCCCCCCRCCCCCCCCCYWCFWTGTQTHERHKRSKTRGTSEPPHEYGHVWQPGFLSSWATCLTKLHKAYFSNRFFAPVRTRSLGATSCNMVLSVIIFAMLRHLLAMRNTRFFETCHHDGQ